MLFKHTKTLRAALDEPDRHRQRQCHVQPQATEVVRRQSFAQDEVGRITHADQQGRPGKTTDLIHLVDHAQAGEHHGDLLQVRQAFAIGDPPGQHHGQRQQEVTEGHIQAVTVERRPHEQPQLHAEQGRGGDQRAHQFRIGHGAPNDLQHALPLPGHHHEHGHARHGQQHAPTEDFHAAQGAEQRRVVIHDGKQHRG
ncbi:hypothetical protein D3C85_1292470 [compost metagenome]